MSENLEQVSKTDLSKAYEALKSAKEATMIVKMDKKTAEGKLKEEVASAKGFYKKDGTTLDLAKVKMGTLKKAIEVKETGVNKLEEELAIQEEYLADIKNGNITKGFVDSYISKIRLEKETKETEKDVKENLKTTIDSDIVEAIAILVDGDIAQEQERLEDDEGKSKKTKKDNSEIVKLAKEIKKKLGI